MGAFGQGLAAHPGHPVVSARLALEPRATTSTPSIETRSKVLEKDGIAAPVRVLITETRPVARVLAPDGVLLVTTPNVHSVQARLRYLLLGELKQFDAIGDPTHITPVFEFPFRRLLARHGLEVAQRWGFPEDGSSPTSRAGLSALAGALSLLGVRGSPAGDQLCLLIRKRPVQDAAAHDKRHAVTAHYA